MRPSPISILDAANILKRSPSNILFCDTCSLLDIIRLPVRESNPMRLSHTLAAISSIESKLGLKQVIIVCPEPIPMEWDNHVIQQVGETENYVQSIIHSYEMLSVLAGTQGITLGSCPVTGSGVTSFLRSLSERILDSSIVVKQDNAITLQASNRAVMSTPPGKRGAVKDCIIYEHILELLRLISSPLPGMKRILLTSNVRDFCINKTTPKPPIDIELATHSAVLCTTWTAANDQL